MSSSESTAHASHESGGSGPQRKRTIQSLPHSQPSAHAADPSPELEEEQELRSPSAAAATTVAAGAVAVVIGTPALTAADRIHSPNKPHLAYASSIAARKPAVDSSATASLADLLVGLREVIA